MPEIIDKSTEIDFDPSEWKEFMPNVFYNRLKRDMICFRCEAEVEEKKSEAAPEEVEEKKSLSPAKELNQVSR